jgi:aspartyl protease family protein
MVFMMQNTKPDSRIISYLFLLSFIFSAHASATEVNVIGLFPNKAVVTIDGGKPKTLSVGQPEYQGVKLIHSDSESAVVEIEGKKQTLKMGQNISAGVGDPDTGTSSASLTADYRGHFVTSGTINGVTTTFLVDTGASLITMSAKEAKRLGISYLGGERGLASTASGVAKVYKVTLNSVKVGGISLNQVDASIVEGDNPQIVLLGMSFLNRVEMKRNGANMALIKRY